MQRMEDLVPNLLLPTTEDGSKARLLFFLNGDLVRQLTDTVPKEAKKAILDAGVMWEGAGWNLRRPKLPNVFCSMRH